MPQVARGVQKLPTIEDVLQRAAARGGLFGPLGELDGCPVRDPPTNDAKHDLIICILILHIIVVYVIERCLEEEQVRVHRAGPAVGAGVRGRAEREETAEKTSTWRCSRAPFDIPDRKSFDHQLHGRASFLGVRRRQRRRRRDVGRLQVRVAVSATTHRGTVDPSQCRGGACDGRAKSLCAHENPSARARRLAAAGAAPGMASWRPGGMRGGPHLGHRCTHDAVDPSRCRGGARDERGRDVSTPPTMPWSVDRTILAAAFQQCRQPRRQGRRQPAQLAMSCGIWPPDEDVHPQDSRKRLCTAEF